MLIGIRLVVSRDFVPRVELLPSVSAFICRYIEPHLRKHPAAEMVVDITALRQGVEEPV